MKKNVLFVIGIFLCMFFLTSVNASENKVALSLSCPKEVEPLNENIICKINAKITNGPITLSSVKVYYDKPLIYGKSTLKDGNTFGNGNREIGTIRLKSSSASGTASVNLIFNVKYGDGSFNAETANANIKVVSKVNTLKLIKVDGTAVSGFNKDTTSYKMNINREKVYITAVKQDGREKVTGTGEKNLKCGSNKIQVTATSEAGNSKKYTLNINRTCSSNTSLKGIALSSGTLSPEFKENIYEYNVNLGKDDKTISINGIKSEASQKISGEVTNKEIGYGKTIIPLTVTSQNGKKTTYKITINKDDTRSDSTQLSSISLSSGNINFSQDKYTYETKVLYDITKIDITATPKDQNSKVSIKGNDNLKVGENIVTITVTSEKGKKQDYKIIVTRLKEGATLGDNPNIKNITVNGYDLPFKYDRNDYRLAIKNEEQLDIKITMDDPTASYTITGNENLKDGSIIKIITKTSDNKSKTYTIEITKSSQAIYYIIAISLVLTVILVPTLVYFKSVRKKKENVNINGYKIDNKDNSHNINKNIIINRKPVQKNEQIIPNIIKEQPKQKKENPSNQQEDFDAGLQDYNPSSNKCPYCNRELMGNPVQCPYCKRKLNKK